MARRNFDELTPVEKYQRLKRQGYFCLAMKWVCIILPYIIIGIVNFDTYFVENNGWKMSLGCILALTVAVISITKEAKKSKSFGGVVGWIIAFALVYFFQVLLTDLLLIVGCGLIGQVVGAFFKLVSDIQLEKANIYRNANIQAESFNSREV